MNEYRYRNIYFNENGYKCRKCTKCFKISLENVENFRFRKDQNSFISVCKICEKEINNKYSAKKQQISTRNLLDKYSIDGYRCYDALKKNCFICDIDGLYYRRCSSEKCNKILIEKDNFYLCNKNREGKIVQEYSIHCKECSKNKMKEFFEKNPEKLKEYNSSKSGRKSKKTWEEKQKAKNPEEYKLKRLEINRKSIIKNKEKRKQKRLTEEFRKKRQENRKKRQEKDPSITIRSNISNAILKALKKGKSDKAGQSILKYLGYKISTLKIHIENQFDKYMSWDNYGSYWHLDHIIPQSDLPYSSMEDENFKICWSLGNLRPLNAKQNMSDGASRVRHKKK